MPTVIDSLIVTLGLDPAPFHKGQKEAASAFSKTKDEAVKSGKSIEKSGKDAAEMFSRLRNQVLALFAVFTAGRGLKSFTEQMTTADAAMGRLARNLGISTSTLSTWEGAARMTGGSAEAMAGSFQSFSDQIQAFKATGESSLIPFLRAISAEGGKVIDINKPMAETFLDLADDMAKIGARNPARASWLGRQLGLDPAMINLLIQGREAVQKYLNAVKGAGVANDADADAARRRQSSFTLLMIAADDFGRKILTSVTPAVVGLIDKMNAWAAKNREWIETKIVEKIEAFARYLSNIDWPSLGKAIQAFVEGANDAAKAMGGWLNVAKILIGVWLGTKLLPVIASVGVLAGAFSGPVVAAITAATVAAYGLHKALEFIDPSNKIGGFLQHWWTGRPEFLGGDGSFGAANPYGALGGSRGMRGASTRDAARRSGRAVGNYSEGNALFDSIIRAEGTARHGNPYDEVLGYGQFGKPGKPISQMTMAEALAFGEQMRKHPNNHYNSSAKGAFQIVNKTQRAAMKALGMSGDEIFDADHQRRMAAWLAKTQGLGAWEGFKVHPELRSRALSGSGASTGARGAAAAGSTYNNSAGDVNTSTAHIGQVVIHTKADDANSIAKDIVPAIQRNLYAGQANYGLA